MDVRPEELSREVVRRFVLAVNAGDELGVWLAVDRVGATLTVDGREEEIGYWLNYEVLFAGAGFGEIVESDGGLTLLATLAGWRARWRFAVAHGVIVRVEITSVALGRSGRLGGCRRSCLKATPSPPTGRSRPPRWKGWAGGRSGSICTSRSV